MSLGTTVRETNVDFDQGAFAFYGLRRLAPAADLTFGLRVNTLRGQLTFTTIGLEVKGDQTWVDPVAGLRLRSTANRPLQFRMYSEIGGFGAGSDFTWQLFPSIAINFTDSFSLDLGYRWLDIDYSTGERNQLFTYDVLTQGPVVGVGFRF
jgi:opacity protein-like surface antigen